MNETQETYYLEVAANLYRGIEAVGGRLKMNNENLLFSPHSFNLQTGVTLIFMDEISSIRKRNTMGIVPNGILIETRRGQQYKFVTWKRQQVIDFVNSRISPG